MSKLEDAIEALIGEEWEHYDIQLERTVWTKYDTHTIEKVLALAHADTEKQIEFRKRVDIVQDEMAMRYNKGKHPTWGDICRWIELLNPTEETATIILTRLKDEETKP